MPVRSSDDADKPTRTRYAIRSDCDARPIADLQDIVSSDSYRDHGVDIRELTDAAWWEGEEPVFQGTRGHAADANPES